MILSDYDNRASLVRVALLADAAVSGFTGLALIIGAELTRDLTGLPPALLLYAGASLLPFAAIVAFIATRARLRRAAIVAVVAYNALWAIDSMAILVLGLVSPTAIGTALVIAQAVAVAGFAILQGAGLRRLAAA